MMKQFLLYMTLFALLLTTALFSGCSTPSGEDTGDENEQELPSKEANPEETHYLFSCRSPKNQETILLYPGMEPSSAIEQLGEPLSYYEAPSCALAGMDQIYTYSGFELTVSLEEKQEQAILTLIRLTDGRNLYWFDRRGIVSGIWRIRSGIRRVPLRKGGNGTGIFNQESTGHFD